MSPAWGPSWRTDRTCSPTGRMWSSSRWLTAGSTCGCGNAARGRPWRAGPAPAPPWWPARWPAWSGGDVISLAVGDPDLPTPRHVVEALQEAAEDPTTHQYPSYYGLPAFRLAIAGWYERRFGVKLDPDTEVLPLVGSKEGLAHLSF